jgi:hypothetical protein
MDPLKMKQIEELLDIQGRLKASEADQARFKQESEQADSDFALNQGLVKSLDSAGEAMLKNPYVGVFKGARDVATPTNFADLVKRRDVAKPIEDKQAVLDQYRAAKLGQFNKTQDQEMEMQKFNRQQDWDVKKIGLQNQIDNTKARQAAEKDLSKRVVPGLGIALTDADAKELKDAKQMKQKLDSQIGELIELRQNKGAEVLDRNAVARGKQLSKDLLLTYKNLAKLGVLSAADTAIIDAIIPQDPTEFRTADFLTGTDSVLSNLQSFRDDLSRDFENNLATRLESRESPQLAGSEEDAAAMAWAQANPNDPRAQAIMQMNGGKSALAR